MAIATTDARIDLQQGAEAMKRGDAAAARAAFSRATMAFPTDSMAWFGLAAACRKLKDPEAGLAAIDRVLALEPASWRGFLVKADCYADMGDARAASSFYSAAVRRAPRQVAALAPEVQAELARAQTMRGQYQQEYESYLRKRLEKMGAGSARFRQSLDLMLGKKQPYVQQPRFFYFPELPQIQYYGREPFPWLNGLEASTAAIRDELLAVMKDDGAFAPYVEEKPGRPKNDPHGMVNNTSWTAFYLIKNGNVVAENAARCPKTMAAVEKAPLAKTPGRTPSVLFSRLEPGARIPPHNGFINTRLICHLGLVVPPGCMFRVGNETREWQEGKAWLFDDTMEHEAHNGSDRTRVILLFDVWRPELSEEERAMVSGMFEAIDSYGGKKGEWDF
jgi:aspartyl/asparaginyl beta-hydroxylase (cupin superfamily)